MLAASALSTGTLSVQRSSAASSSTDLAQAGEPAVALEWTQPDAVAQAPPQVQQTSSWQWLPYISTKAQIHFTQKTGSPPSHVGSPRRKPQYSPAAIASYPGLMFAQFPQDIKRPVLYQHE